MNPANGVPVQRARQTVISVKGLRKAFGKQVVLDGIDLDVKRGTVFSLLGPNGAGKTTAIHILSTLLAPDAGQIVIDGHDLAREPDKVRGQIGLTGQVSAVDNLFTGAENLRLMADLRHMGKSRGAKRVAELLERFDLVEAANKPVQTYSGGMRRRLDLAMTLVEEPQIIFLDEPTTGLDPRSRRTMWEIIRELTGRGITVFLTTQYLEEADRLSDWIALLDHGKIVAEGTPAQLKRLVPGGHIRLQFSDESELARASALLDGSVRDVESLALQVPSDGGVNSLRSVLDRLSSQSIDVATLSVETPDLDDVFLTLTGKPGMTEGALR
jgi:ABC-2 type transport system ATP-binding protein